MKSRFFFLTVSLITVLLAVSCAPTTPAETVVLPATSAPVESAPATEAVVPTSEANSVELTEAPVVQAVATSRGSDLHATDPSTVSLASGQFQFVEFFRYT
ncbi:MAG TPA: hypothetical protein DHW49_07065 [Anaerolineae bacterium]|nr:hypothetical protein [Anaerolineae bacterium]